MVRKQIVTANKAVSCLYEKDRPFADSRDLGEYMGVTPQAIRNCHERIASHPEIKTGKAGGSRVYWLVSVKIPENPTDAEKPVKP